MGTYDTTNVYTVIGSFELAYRGSIECTQCRSNRDANDVSIVYSVVSANSATYQSTIENTQCSSDRDTDNVSNFISAIESSHTNTIEHPQFCSNVVAYYATIFYAVISAIE